MNTDVELRNEEIVRCARTALIFAAITLIPGQILSMIFPKVSSQIWLSAGLIAGAVFALLGKSRPEKGTLFAEKNRMTGTAFFVTLGAFLLAKLVSMAAVLPPLMLLGEEKMAQFANLARADESLIYTFISMGLVTPFCEEIVFRGCIGNRFKKYGIWFAAIMSSLLFAMYHCNVAQLFTTFLPGVVLFYVAMNYSIKWSILFHFINNAVLTTVPTALQKLMPESFIAGYGEYILEAALIILALCLMKKDSAMEKAKAFFSGPENEKGVYKAAIGNVWFIVLALIIIILTAAMVAMIEGGVPLPVQ